MPEWTKIESSTFRFLASINIAPTFFIKDPQLFPISEEMPPEKKVEVLKKANELIENMTYCAPYAISTGDTRTRQIEYESKFIRFSPGQAGLPTIKDLDILIYCVTWMANAVKDGRDHDVRTIYRFDVDDFYEFSCRPQNGDRERNFIDGLNRLASSTVSTNAKPLGVECHRFNFIEQFDLVRDDRNHLSSVEIKIPYILCALPYTHIFDPISDNYLALTPTHRLLFLFLNTFCEERKKTVSFEKLRAITETTAPLNKCLPVFEELASLKFPWLEIEVDTRSKEVVFWRTKKQKQLEYLC